jgi:hypothetical protein
MWLLSGGLAVVAVLGVVGVWVFLTVQGANKFKSAFRVQTYA